MGGPKRMATGFATNKSISNTCGQRCQKISGVSRCVVTADIMTQLVEAMMMA